LPAYGSYGLMFLPAWLTNFVAACGLAHSMAVTAAYDGCFGVYEQVTAMAQDEKFSYWLTF